MKRILCVLLSNWPIDRVNRRRHASRDPLVLVRTAANRQEVVAVSDEAHRFGIRIGMTLAQARALCAHVRHLEHEPHRDAVALEAMARWMMRFSPVVCLPPLTPGPEGIFLDLTGCERTFHGLDNLLRQISTALKKFRIRARLAVAPTPGTAWATAFCSENPLVILEDNLEQALANLPPIALRIPPEMALALQHLGIDTVGQLMRLPRSSLPARFGDELLLRLDQALGTKPEPLTPLEPFSPIEARMDFDGPVDSLEAIWIVFKKLITQIVVELLRRGHGTRELELQFFRPYAVTLSKTIHLSRPSRDPKNIFNLLRCAMETLETDVGFLGIQLTVTRSQRVRDEQIQLLEHEEFIAETELSHLIERLCIRLGDKVIAQPVLVESHVPEKRVQGSRFRVQQKRSSDLNPEPRTLNPPVRPLHLLTTPELIGVMVSPSHDRDGRPISVSWRGQVHRLSHSIGPERIAGQWWEGHHRTRDYFDVEDEDGIRLWIFRVLETGKWYVHGEFE